MIREDGSMGCDMQDCDELAVWRITAADQIDNRVTTANTVNCDDHAIAIVLSMMNDERFNSVMARRLDRVGTRV